MQLRDTEVKLHTIYCIAHPCLCAFAAEAYSRSEFTASTKNSNVCAAVHRHVTKHILGHWSRCMLISTIYCIAHSCLCACAAEAYSWHWSRCMCPDQ